MMTTMTMMKIMMITIRTMMIKIKMMMMMKMLMMIMIRRMIKYDSELSYGGFRIHEQIKEMHKKMK